MRPSLTIGEVFDRVFAIYRDHAGVLLPVAFWMYLVAAILNGIADQDDLALLSVGGIVGLIISTVYAGFVVALVRDVEAGEREIRIGKLFDSVLPVAATLFFAALLAAIGMFVGFLLLILPGLILLTIWAVIAPAIVIERKGVFDSFRRSRELVSGYGWPVFGALVVSLILVLVAGLILVSVATAIADGPILRVVFSALASTVTAPISALVTAVLYYRLLALKGSAPSDHPPSPEPVPQDPASP